MTDITFALAGNPNTGKSTLFNSLTGLRQHTGNWPGKTVEKKIGKRRFGDLTVEFVDLPGTYSLAAYSPDEIVARDYMIAEHPDAVVCVVDATNLERNLYLAVQLLELGIPVVVALNMTDQARSLGIEIDHQRLSELLGNAPVVPTTASRGEGIDQLLSKAIQYVHSSNQEESIDASCHCRCQVPSTFQVNYGPELEAAIRHLTVTAERSHLPLNGYCPRWMALKLLEGEEDIVNRILDEPGGLPVVQASLAEAAQLESLCGDNVEMVTADQRYRAVSEISRQVVRRPTAARTSLTERIDYIVANRLVGLPVFLAVMFVIFRLVIDVSAPFLDWVDDVISGPISGGLSALLLWLSAAEWLHSLVIDGIVAGVGGILTFVPGLIVLFFFLALLEDSGYMARAAFVMDRFMRFIGLHGKSVIPLMLGFGCAVPAVYATRTVASRRNRLLTALLIPFMSCSARLPVYVVFALAFFGSRASTVIWSMYMLGIAVAILIGFIFSRTLLKPDENTAFVLELPPYRLPTLKSLAIHTWENTREFVRKAGTVILAISVILWFLLNLPWGVNDQQASYYGRLSTLITPVMEPAGFGSYETSGALITGFIAKELVVSTLSQIYLGEESIQGTTSDISSLEEVSVAHKVLEEVSGIIRGFIQATLDAGRALLSLLPGVDLGVQEATAEDTTLSQALQSRFSPLAAFAFLVFVLLYIPCIATVGAIKQEFGGRWATAIAMYQTLVAWLAAVAIFQGGRLLGFG